MTPSQQKAAELIEKFKDYVHGYVGSSMLTNTEYPELIEKRAKKCAIIHVEGIIEVLERKWFEIDFWTEELGELMKYWQEVKKELTI